MNQESAAILVATDGSAHSRRVLSHAAAFAAVRGDSLCLLRVVDSKAAPAAIAAAEAENAAVLSQAGLQGSALAVALEPNEKVSDAVVRAAKSAGAEMIAMDTRGHGAIHHALQGSVALEVVAKTDLPVMLTGAEIGDPPAGEPYRLLVTSDGSAASQDVVRALAPLLTPGLFAVTLLSVVEKAPGGESDAAATSAAEKQLNTLREMFSPDLSVEIKVREIARLGGIDTAILEEARSLGARAIVASTHGVSASRHLLAGSTALQILGRSSLPVIMASALA